jgi:hypothetical protein
MAEVPKHLRAQIRAALVALLANVNTDVGDHVFTGRVMPLRDGQVPAIDIDIARAENRQDGGRIDSDAISDPTRLLQRHPTLAIAVSVKNSDGYLDAVDAIYADIEAAVAGDNTLGGLCMRITPVGEPGVMLDGSGEKIVARAEMPFEVECATLFNAPTRAA